MTLPTNRKAALQAGERYYQGNGCSNGHDGTRYTSNRLCVACGKAQSGMTYNADKASAAAKKRAYRAKLATDKAALLESPLGRFYCAIID